MVDPMPDGRLDALRNMAAPSPDETMGGAEDGEATDITLAEMSDCLGAFTQMDGVDPEMAKDLSQAQQLIEKWADRSEGDVQDDEAAEGEDVPVPTEGT